MLQAIVRTFLAAMLAVVALADAAEPPIAGAESSHTCPGFQIAQVKVEGQSFDITSCCRQGCGGACCRCGSPNGFLSDCTTPCATARASEMLAAKRISLPQGLVVVGRLVHAQTKAPLANERVKLTLPGGASYFGSSQSDGSFRIEISGKASNAVTPTDVGDLPFVPSSELGPAEPKEYQLFMMPQTAGKTS